MTQFSRRNILRTGAGLLAASGLSAQNNSITARDVIQRMRDNLGVPWREQTVDTFKAGDPNTQVTGIATTVTATLDVLRRAASAGRNLIITHEPTFYNHEDRTQEFTGASIFIAKQSYIEKHGLVIFRFHDHLHARRPDMVFTALAEALAWKKYGTENPRLFVVPPTSLAELADDIRSRLKVRSMRAIGDPKLRVSKVALMPGGAGVRGMVRWIDRDNVDLLVIGETREWEGIEYVRDAIASGTKVGLLWLGHAPTEEPGMKECAAWLKTFVAEVPIEFIPAGEPLWTP